MTHDETTTQDNGTGMTLRDYFAAKAMAAYIAESYLGARAAGEDGCFWDPSDIASLAYDQAEAMLMARGIYDEGPAS